MEAKPTKEFYKIAKTLNSAVSIRIINLLMENRHEMMTMTIISSKIDMSKSRVRYHIDCLKEINVIHPVEDGNEVLLFLDTERLEIYYNTAKYLKANMSARTEKRESYLYG